MSSLRALTLGHPVHTVPAIANAIIAPLKVVFFSGGTTLGVFTYPGISTALANSVARVNGQLGLLLGATANGGSTAVNGAATVMLWGSVSGLSGVPASVGDPVFVDDAGDISLTAGTYKRQIGEVLAITAGATYTMLFTGGQVRPLQSFETTATALTFPIFNGPYDVRNSYVTQDTDDAVTFGRGWRVHSRTVVINDGATASLDKEYTHIRIQRGTVTPAARTVVLPERPKDGFVIIVKDEDNSAAASNINITTSGGGAGADINEAPPPYTLTVNGQAVVLVYNEALSNWDAVAKF